MIQRIAGVQAGWSLPLLLVLACSDVTSPSPPEVLSATLSPAGPLAYTLEVTLSRPAPLTVRYGADGEPHQLQVRSEEGTEHTLLLTRLRAGRSYSYEIGDAGHTGTFTTGPLPEDLAAIAFSASGTPTVPLVLVHLFEPDGFHGYAIVDAQGEVVWYWRAVNFPYGMTRRANGNFVLLDHGRGLVEVTPAGAEVNLLAQDLAEREMHHDVIATPWNTLLFIAFDGRDIEGGRLLGEAIWEWTPESGTAVKRWSSWDHLSPESDRGPRFGGEWLHANALSVGPRGNVLVSMHYLNQVISIAPDWQGLEWRLGGVNATVTLEEAVQFSGQHTAREIAEGRVLLFDNRHEPGDYSRAAEYVLKGKLATLAWEWRTPSDNFASIVSSARRLPNGHTLIGFGTSAGIVVSSGPTEVFEVTSAGTHIWHLLVSGTWIMFRAEPIWAIGAEEPA